MAPPSSISKGLNLSLHAEDKNTEVTQATETPISLTQGTRSGRVCKPAETLNLRCLWTVRDIVNRGKMGVLLNNSMEVCFVSC